MREIYVKYITNVADSSTKHLAHRELLIQIEANDDYLSLTDKQFLIQMAIDFSEKFRKTFFWKRASLLAKEIKRINTLIN